MPSSSSLSLKEQGATAFRAGRWEEAIDFYSQALKGVDEVQEEEEAGSLYCSRAEARIHAYQFDLGEGAGASYSLSALLPRERRS